MPAVATIVPCRSPNPPKEDDEIIFAASERELTAFVDDCSECVLAVCRKQIFSELSGALPNASSCQKTRQAREGMLLTFNPSDSSSKPKARRIVRVGWNCVSRNDSIVDLSDVESDQLMHGGPWASNVQDADQCTFVVGASSTPDDITWWITRF